MQAPAPTNSGGLDRRTLLLGGASLAGAAGLGAVAQSLIKPTPVFVAAGQRYDGPLHQTIADGLLATGLDPAWLRGRRVLLKPNLVEPSRRIPHMTTHPAMIVAAAEALRRWGARVSVGEAPGHVRDTEMALVESGVAEALRDARIPFADLNYEEVGWRRNRGRFSKLPGIYFPRSVLEADLIVSMPKMKTHHWVGVTCATKNLYGILPGIKYGWPKNVLHHHGIPQTVADIASSAPKTIAIVDGIDCMEGDGPILGSLKHMGLVLVGQSLPSVDATAARIMGLEPTRIEYLHLASRRLGPLDDRRIEQRGEPWRSVADPFQVLDEPHLECLRSTPEERLVT
ncbi:hypothetical protein Pla175_35130 [Pirellulimonas nuda]|uniref:DUF362 domain-containing protein n=1 Tax=Pirellulimonas nuda TaxID=2528009 RepID=A0A518DF56_9BACT|nr:DUF362 domain-containing protein [Pirellulimonas nuda]QDU90113.1 hypothetical protein Pla175_35130 [Pirellulimonas nuda]